MKNKSIILNSALLIITIVFSIISGCSSSNRVEQNLTNETTIADVNDNETVKNFAYNITNPNNPIIMDSVMYYADHSGVWKVESGQKKVQISICPGERISTDGNTILYSYNDVEHDKGIIRSVKSDGTNDVEICTTAPNPTVITEIDEKIIYTAVNEEKTAISLYSFDMATEKTSILAKDVFKCSNSINHIIVYLDSGGSEFSIVGKLHVLDLSTGEDKLIDSADYDKVLYQIGSVVYSVSCVIGPEREYHLCAYDLKNSEQKDIHTMLESTANTGVRTFGAYDKYIVYGVEDYSVTNSSYTYYRFDIITNEKNEITERSHGLGTLLSSNNEVVYLYDTAAYLNDSSEPIVKYNSDEYYDFVAYFDGNLYFRNDDEIIEIYQHSKASSTEKPTLDDPILENYFGLEMTDLIDRLGNEYNYIDLPETGLMNCVSFNSLSDVAFGMSTDNEQVELICIKDCDESIQLTVDLTNNMTGNEVLALKNKYSISENYSALTESNVITVKRNDGLILSYEWSTSDYLDNNADFISMQIL